MLAASFLQGTCSRIDCRQFNNIGFVISRLSIQTNAHSWPERMAAALANNWILVVAACLPPLAAPASPAAAPAPASLSQHMRRRCLLRSHAPLHSETKLLGEGEEQQKTKMLLAHQFAVMKGCLASSNSSSRNGSNILSCRRTEQQHSQWVQGAAGARGRRAATMGNSSFNSI